MIAPVPLEWGTRDPDNGVRHAWFKKANERRVSVCAYPATEYDEERWTAPHPSLAPQCSACMNRVGDGDEVNIQPLLKALVRRYPYSTTRGGLAHNVPMMANYVLADLLMAMFVEARLAGWFMVRGHKQWLALAKLREAFGVAKVSM